MDIRKKIQTVLGRMTLVLMTSLFLCGCEQDNKSSPSEQASTSSGNDGTFWNGTTFSVYYHAVNDTDVDTNARIQGPDGGYQAVVKAHAAYDFWAQNKPDGTTIELDVWAPRLSRWVYQDSVKISGADVRRTVRLTAQGIGGL